jgi:hypothetical protein
MYYNIDYLIYIYIKKENPRRCQRYIAKSLKATAK